MVHSQELEVCVYLPEKDWPAFASNRPGRYAETKLFMKIIICNYKFLSHGFFSALTLLLGVASARNTTGSVTGTLTNSSGSAFAGASVVLSNNATADKYTPRTSDSGDYQFLTFVPLSTRPVSKALCLQRGWGSGSARDARERHYGSRRHFPGITVTQQASTIQSENGSLAQITRGKSN